MAYPFLNSPTNPSLAPVICISGGAYGSASVQAAVAQARACGAIPMVVTNHEGRDARADIARADAVWVLGSDFDIPPELYTGGYPEGDPRRQVHPQTRSAATDPKAAARLAYEQQLLALAQERKVPTLGVCAAAQLVNVMHGGGLLQHIPDQIGNELHQQDKQHIPSYCPVTAVTMDRNSALGGIAGATRTLYTPSYPPPAGSVGVNENSFHHQAIDPDRVGSGLRVVAISDAYTNGQGQARYLPEAVEPDPNGPLADWPLVAVQWHPEFGASNVSANLIGQFVASGRHYAETHPRDRSHDQTAAMATSLVSSRAPVVSMAERVRMQPAATRQIA